MKHTEDKIQIAAVRWFKLHYPEIVIHHSPNGGYRTKAEAGIFKAMGTMAGFADLIILKPTMNYNAFFIEFKSEKGRQTQSQKDFQSKCEEYGYKYAICRSVEDFRKIVKNYLIWGT